jgi:hypothetical protein
MNKYSNVLLTLILVLVLINLVLTVTVINKQAAQVNSMADMSESLDSEIARAWGKKVADMYNQQDHQALYAMFDEQARVKISHQQLETQLKKLFQLFGAIEESAFVSADKIAEKDDAQYYKLIFNVRVKENSRRPATLSITVVRKNNAVSLYGVRINASQSLD